MTTTDSPILVLGGTGKTGRRVAERLTARGVPVRIGSRSAAPAFDWDDRDTWAAALDGARAVYISYYPDLALPGAADTVGAFAEQALAAGVPRLVLLSGRGEEEAEKTEALIQASGAEWTILRATWFAQNFSESFMAEGVAAGELALPADSVREPFVDVEDIAEIAVAALTEDGHAGQLYELTGPRLLTFGDAVGEIGAVLGRPVRFVGPARRLRQGAERAGRPAGRGCPHHLPVRRGARRAQRAVDRRRRACARAPAARLRRLRAGDGRGGRVGRVSPALYGLTLAAALGCGLNAGVFFAFSSFIMPGLDRLPPDQGIAAMQSINVTAVRPLFMTALFGTALLCIVLIVWGAVSLGEPPSPWLVAGGVVFVLGSIVVTIAGNVPLNDAVDALDPSAAGAARDWAGYVHDWNLWNHVRAVTGLLAAGAFTVALTL